MLDHLDLLDDAAPPAIEAATLASVHARANGLRRRSRLTSLGAVVAVLIVVAGAATIARNHDHAVKVISPPNTTTAPTTNPHIETSKQSIGTLPSGLRVTLTVETPTVVLGGDVGMSVEVVNDTGTTKTIGVGDVQCTFQVRLVLRDSTGTDVAHNTGASCYEVGRRLQPGERVEAPATVSSSSVALPEHEHSSRYEVGLVALSNHPSTLLIPPLPVEIVAPEVSGHLKIAQTNVNPGDIVNGMLVINNNSRDAIAYRVGCYGERSWEVDFGKNGVPFPVGMAVPGCPVQNNDRRELQVGTNRFPFTVRASYEGCTGFGRPTIDSPPCEADGSIPPLEPGSYQILFSGLGTFASLDIPGATVTVR